MECLREIISKDVTVYSELFIIHKSHIKKFQAALSTECEKTNHNSRELPINNLLKILIIKLKISI